MGSPADEGWVTALPLDLLRDRRPARVSVDGDDVLLVRDGDRLFAIGNRCTHQGAPLSTGRVTFAGSLASVTCPAHGSTFDLQTGRVLRSPAGEPEPVFDVRLTDGSIELRRATAT
ncbi:MAG: Rieske (2Fe-2S) protein [Actinomycetota bacterium]